jgi:nitrogen fixation NifU-like protein
MKMPDLDALYRQVVLEHYRNPRGRDPVPGANLHGEGQNPVCGDEVELHARVQEGRITGIQVRGKGCSISVASGSMLAEMLEGKTLEEARRYLEAFRAILHGEAAPADLDLGDLEALEGVRRFPVRIKCALLPWTTLEQALEAARREEGHDGGKRSGEAT